MKTGTRKVSEDCKREFVLLLDKPLDGLLQIKELTFS